MNKNSSQAASTDLKRKIKDWIRLHGRRIPGITHWLQIATGVFLVTLGCYLGKTPFDLIRGGIRTSGQIVRFDHVTSTSTNARGFLSSYSAFHPVVKFEVDGKRVQFRDRFGSASAARIHDVVAVLFSSQTPSVAAINRPVLNWIPWAPVLIVGAFLFLVGAAGKVREAKC